MPQNFTVVDRQQRYLFPESIDQWLPKSHFAWFVVETVDLLDLSAFLARYREDGAGQRAYHPSIMVAVLFYAYCSGERSSRQIEKRCMEDVAYRVIAANLQPDHATLARFRADFQSDLGDLFKQILQLCQNAGLIKAGSVSLDGTKLKANAALDQNRTAEHLKKLVDSMLEEAAQKDAAENRLFGDARGDELPDDLRDPHSRKERLKACLKRLEDEAQAAREAQQKLIDSRAAEEAKGKKFGGHKVLSPEEKVNDKAKANMTDPESRVMKTRQGLRQCYNAQAVALENQIVIAADVTQVANDYQQAVPMLTQAKANLAAVKSTMALGAVLMDAGYFSHENAEAETMLNVELFMPTEKKWRATEEEQRQADELGELPASDKARKRLERRLATSRGQAMYKKRGQTIEPVFGQIKTVQRGGQCSRRGVEAVRQEWKFTCTAHNVLKLWRSTRAIKIKS